MCGFKLARLQSIAAMGADLASFKLKVFEMGLFVDTAK